MNVTPKIAGAGICCLDHIMVAPQIPWGDGTRASDYCAQGGGFVATAMVACARLEADCRFFSLLGDDQTGDQILAGLREECVSLDEIVRFPGGESPFSFIHVDDRTGERTIFHRAAQGLNWTPKTHHLDLISECGALLIDDYYVDLSLAASIKAREFGVPVVADMTPKEKNFHLLGSVDILIAPQHFARKVGLEHDLDRALDAIHEMGPTTAVITLGGDGWVYSDPNGRGRGKAFKIDVVDTTGAGDVFHGAFAYGLALKWGTARCCEFASAVAAMKCTKVGGRTGIPTLSQVTEFLKVRSGMDWDGLF